MSYAVLKWTHVCAATATFCGFLARGLGLFCGAPWVRHRLARILPHAIDTLLLLSAIGMLWSLRLWPWSLPWLEAKVCGLMVYIVLGFVALRPARSAALKASALNRLAWVGALVVFAYIVSVALTKDPLPSVNREDGAVALQSAQ